MPSKNKDFFDDFIHYAKKLYGEDNISLHRPIFEGNEKKYLTECIDSNFVSSVGKRVSDFENAIAKFTGAKYAIATVNGTSALHIAIKLSGCEFGDEVITQSATFIATCNAISYAGGKPVFVDVDENTLGMSPTSLKCFLEKNAHIKNGKAVNKKSGNIIKCCIPMHTFGFPCQISEIKDICEEWNINLIEDAAESLGSYVDSKHTGTFGKIGTLSFNGNKLITTGGGGMIITDDEEISLRAKHITTTSKVPHEYEFVHDEIGYNYRMPNINAALGCAQVEKLQDFIASKRDISIKWKTFFNNYDVDFVESVPPNRSNYWLNTILMESLEERNEFLNYTNKNNVMTRPIWTLMSELEMYKECQNDGLIQSKLLSERIVNIPSSVPFNS